MDDSIYTVRLLVTSNHQVVPGLQPTYNYLKKSHFEAIYDLRAEDTKDIRRSEIFSERAFVRFITKSPSSNTASMIKIPIRQENVGRLVILKHDK